MRFSQRELRGLGVVAIGGQIQRVSSKLFLVKSQTSIDSSYRVGWTTGKWKCDCPDYVKRVKPCKHIHAVNFLLDLPSMILSNSKTLERTCPHCGSEESWMKGSRYNKAGAVRLRVCKKCKKQFKDEITAESKGTNMTLALIAFDLHFKAMSLRDIKNHIWQIYGIDKPVSTLHRWIVKLTGTMQEALSSFKLEVGDKWLADEIFLKVNGDMRYLWNIMDYETRIHIVSILTEGRGAEQALNAIKEAISKAGKEPEKLITDGLQSYPKALKELPDNHIKHIGNVGLTSQEDNNNRVERLHGTVRSWTKPQRGLKSRAPELCDMHHLYYNLIRPHMALQGKTPIKTGKDGRWLTFLVDKKRNTQVKTSGKPDFSD